MRWLIVLLILTMFLAGGVPAQQDDELIFPCLGDPASLILVRTYPRQHWTFPLSEWALMADSVTGSTIWTGDGFDMPDNAKHLYTVFGKRIDGTTFEVWFFDSRDTDNWYLLMLDDTQTDYHCGCGAWRVDELTMTDWLHPILYRWF